MFHGLFLVFLASANLAFGGGVQPLPALPNGAVANSVQTDLAGNIYVAGEFFPNPTNPNAPAHAFAGKLAPDGSEVIWWTQLAGSKDDRALAMALGADNSAYVTGTTSSADFPTTPGSMQPTASVAGGAFAAKLNPAGGVIYSTYVGGSAGTSGNAIAVDSSGDAFVTGALGLGGVFPTTPGAVMGATSTSEETAYLLELDPAGSTALVAIAGFGGYQIAVDAEGNIYAAGAFVGPLAPTTPGAVQSTAARNICIEGFSMASPCIYQHIAKIDPTGTKLIYATYIAGEYGAVPQGMAVDSTGNVIVAGSTNSFDYPTTPGAYQPEYFGEPEEAQAVLLTVAPISAGYVTKLNASGTGLLWSTYFGGSGTTRSGSLPMGDSIAGMAIDAGGNILFAGLAYSSDLPGLWMTPLTSRPTYSNPLNFVARLSPDGSTLSPTLLLPSATALGGIAVRTDGTAIFGSPLATASLSPIARVAAICDSADNAKLVSIAPGQLLTLYGTDLAPTDPALPANGFPTAFNGVTVTFNGIAAPILYTSGIQINLQVPYEVAGQSQVTMQISSQSVSPAVSESYTLAGVDYQPSVFLSSAGFQQPFLDITTCNSQQVAGLQPLALNADGTLNSCSNPAVSGSAVTIFLNGLGITSPSEMTGAMNSSPIAVTPGVTLLVGDPTAVNILSTETLPASITGLAQVQIEVTSTSPFLNILLQEGSAGTVRVRGPGVVIWIKPNGSAASFKAAPVTRK
ncbi:MAG: SBBP repeat-containing protein [Bryobacteraceae bacterium]